MFVRSRLAHLAAVAVVAPLLTVVAAGAAAAHGAPLNPVSRSVACGSDGRFTTTPACRAARAGEQGQWFEQWDNVRVAGVNGRDRTTIPDGRLCSGGIAGFGGLDLARADWPSTTLRAGKAITVSYRGTIPHAGSFRMYVTKDGYSPKQALRWSDLEAKPFLTATDPAFSSGAYTFRGTLPKGKAGRHILYTVWQNSSTADTYYSCSDVVFTKPARAVATARPAPTTKAASGPVKTKSSTRRPSAAPSATATVTPTPPIGTPAVGLGNAQKLSTPVDTGSRLMPMLAVGGLLLLAGTGGAVAFTRRRRDQSQP